MEEVKTIKLHVQIYVIIHSMVQISNDHLVL